MVAEDLTRFDGMQELTTKFMKNLGEAAVKLSAEEQLQAMSVVVALFHITLRGVYGDENYKRIVINSWMGMKQAEEDAKKEQSGG